MLSHICTFVHLLVFHYPFIHSLVVLTDLYPTSPPLSIIMGHSVHNQALPQNTPTQCTYIHYRLQTQYTLTQLCSSWSLEITSLVCAQRLRKVQSLETERQCLVGSWGTLPGNKRKICFSIFKVYTRELCVCVCV